MLKHFLLVKSFEEFQEKARTIFETAIKTKVAEVQEELKAQYETTLEEEVSTIKGRTDYQS